jgi:hypothetical protein
MAAQNERLADTGGLVEGGSWTGTGPAGGCGSSIGVGTPLGAPGSGGTELGSTGLGNGGTVDGAGTSPALAFLGIGCWVMVWIRVKSFCRTEVQGT